MLLHEISKSSRNTDFTNAFPTLPDLQCEAFRNYLRQAPKAHTTPSSVGFVLISSQRASLGWNLPNEAFLRGTGGPPWKYT